jgi:hypothetical protein
VFNNVECPLILRETHDEDDGMWQTICLMRIRASVGILCLFALIAGCDRHPAAEAAPKRSTIVWPDLKEFPSFRHRLATQDDITAGHAAFLVPGPGGPRDAPIGTPLDVEVPQYAYHVDRASGSKAPGILMQAIEVHGTKIGAIMSIGDRKFSIATMDEFELLGTKPPG